jgi:hypothetical protein
LTVASKRNGSFQILICEDIGINPFVPELNAWCSMQQTTGAISYIINTMMGYLLCPSVVITSITLCDWYMWQAPMG